MAATAISLKDEGNRYFQKGDYTAAEGLYSKAIVTDPKNPAIYTNRALARLKLEMWDGVVDDCKTCLDLAPNNMKANFYLSQAELKLRDYDAAVAHCVRAQELCVLTEDKSITNITNHLLECKKERWEDKERRRVRETDQLQHEVYEIVARERDAAVAAVENESERSEIAAEWEAKLNRLSETFERARSNSEKRRKVPEWAIDDITFSIMVDPVMTKLASRTSERPFSNTSDANAPTL